MNKLLFVSITVLSCMFTNSSVYCAFSGARIGQAEWLLFTLIAQNTLRAETEAAELTTNGNIANLNVRYSSQFIQNGSSLLEYAMMYKSKKIVAALLNLGQFIAPTDPTQHAPIFFHLFLELVQDKPLFEKLLSKIINPAHELNKVFAGETALEHWTKKRSCLNLLCYCVDEADEIASVLAALTERYSRQTTYL